MNALPPLVAPAAELTRDDIARYSRHLLIPGIGVGGQRRLKNARVLVIGAGGLGSPVLMYLAAAGAGTIGIVEFDSVEMSNLQRQVIHGESDLGRPKGESARESIRNINPHVEVRWHNLRLENRNAVNIFRQYDLIVDGTDNFATRYLVNDAAALAGKPYVWGSIFRFEGQVSVFWEDAPHGRGVTYRDLFPDPPAPGTVPSCAEGGVFGALCATIGSLMATEAIKLITGTGDPLLGRVLVYDALAMSFRSLGLRRAAGAPRITELTDYEEFCGTAIAPSAGDSSIAPTELADLLSSAAPPVLIDVRERTEWEIVRIEGATLVPHSEFDSGAALSQLPQDREVVLYCKTGVRSAEALEALHKAGLKNARHLRGGLAAWVKQVDRSLPMY
ncbi:molybdopterin-synthase adenylyltransferase MoeB [Hoyosella altamirensis]|uniref:Probable adenylyltransferase/sulfurtransferase MoeZ n=1 Tax=Hoyosella altamirensis TaxID=616997 RepID=A0A839RHB0_9ACTN|nr:molybdopterin-synthase adenylyltransferase MoeB [Hoyosella altamirensis]MBB3035669.1 adenylyltransferase/sulfurtransferase [Hoyosella altamirensis]